MNKLVYLINKRNSRKLSREDTINELKQLFIVDKLTLTQARKAKPYVFKSIKSYFQNNKEALNEAGINYDDVLAINKRNSRKLSREDTINELKQLFIVDKLTLTQARKAKPYVFKNIKSYFQNNREALNEAGINYDDVLVRNLRNAGRLAEEKIVDEIFYELGIKFTKGYTKKIKPDFVFKHFWADAKLKYNDKNGWKQSIKKYKNHTRQLIIIYIFDPDYGLHKIEPKILATHINYYIKQLPRHRQIFYKELIDDIRQFHLEENVDFDELLQIHNDIEVDKLLGKASVRKNNLTYSVSSETWQQSIE